ncbi:RagB/SusD family nutrient uptake outer membrane protein [Pedobacter mucosus]|uniref:RagB/SusD family nutrient uptake outer membrane protein n=1 Tax=Pedobacter mucosus TaxID=2895286 RepID=UPI001EE3D15B|nr:RagB/SusD family nutrient uptake outer membrane protein [Pedobacter mucosus]UKT63067.1 RagB/SusD family nutrient uptake outer membrane protein [Pedobacter mucosus]
MKKQLILSVLILLCSLTGCKKFLEEENKSNIVSNDYYATAEGYEKLINSTYSTLRKVYSSPYLFCGGTDMYVEGRDAQPAGISEYQNLNPDNAEVTAFYTNIYSSIQLCNTALYFNSNTATTANLAMRRGEVKFIRAYYYFLMVQTFGGVSIVTERFDTPIEEFKRNTAQETYDFVIKEMTEALSLVPETSTDFGRVTKKAVRHFLAKAYLTRGYETFGTAQDFTTAATLADEAIAGKTLTTSFENLFYPGNEKDAEILFSIQFDAASLPSASTGGNTQAAFFGPYQGGSGATQGYPYRTYVLVPTLYTFNTFTENDARFDATFMINLYTRYYDYYDRSTERANLNIRFYYKPKWDLTTDAAWKAIDPTHRATTTIIPYSNAWQAGRTTVLDNASPSVKKFDDPKSQFGGATSTRDLFLARLGETYLIAAEAYFKAGNLAVAAQRINEVRRRAAKTGKTAEMAITVADVNLNFILDERARELVGEYQRWFDLKRTGTLVDRTRLYNRDIKANWFDKGINPFLGSGGQLKLLRPIPSRAINLNAGPFAQNPGY